MTADPEYTGFSTPQSVLAWDIILGNFDTTDFIPFLMVAARAAEIEFAVLLGAVKDGWVRMVMLVKPTTIYWSVTPEEFLYT